MANDIRIKIAALLAKAQASDHEGEANLFFAKAQELMEEHQVELFELHTSDPIGKTVGGTYQQGPTSYKSKVECALAQFYGAKPILDGTAKHWRVLLVGPESARLTTELMLAYVWTQVCREGNKISKASGGRSSSGAAIREVAKALCSRIYRELTAKKAQPAKDGTSFSLTVVDAIEAFAAKEVGELVDVKSRPVCLTEAGIAAAKNISLSHQVHTGAKSLRLE